MNDDRTAAPHSRLLLTALLLAAVALRLPNLGGPLDDPHFWRQAETAQYARSFLEGGIDLLHPSVCWLGAHRTLVEEFPLPEALMALGYRVAGGESLPLARSITLAFYLGAALYLFLLVRRLLDEETGLLALGLFAALPLGLYYSRGVHVDPAALCFVHAAGFHAARAQEEGRGRDFALAGLWAVPACLIKAPYALPLALPLALLALTRWHGARVAGLISAALPAVAAFALWRHHSAAVNGAVPDWSFIPGFAADVAKHTRGAADWYFGTPAMRADPAVWAMLLHRLRSALGGWTGELLLALGLAATPWAARRYGGRFVLFVWGWAVGAFLYVLLFLNLNVIHNYYQLPLLAPAATVAAMGLATARRAWARVAPASRGLAAAAVVAVLALVAWRAVEAGVRHYYQLDRTRLESGAFAARHCPPEALLIAVTARTSATDDPRLLYCAHRYGWSVPLAALSPQVVERLRRLGASRLLVVLDRPDPPAVVALAARYPAVAESLSVRPWRARLFDLGGADGAAGQ